jgi:phosphoglycolate phosphatase
MTTANPPSSSLRWTGIKAVLFDLDGTLADTAPDLAGALNRMRVERRLDPLPLSVLRPVASAGARGLLGAGLNLKPDDADYDTARIEFLAHYEANLAHETHLFEGIPALLDALTARGLPWGIVTNKAHRFTMPVLAGLGLTDQAAVVISGDTTPHAKPHPEPLFEACRRLGISPNEAIYIGDDLRDIQAAKAADMPSIAVAYGYLGAEIPIQHWNADAIIDSPLALLAYLP